MYQALRFSVLQIGIQFRYSANDKIGSARRIDFWRACHSPTAWIFSTASWGKIK
jgi:hypothetical protein